MKSNKEVVYFFGFRQALFFVAIAIGKLAKKYYVRKNEGGIIKDIYVGKSKAIKKLFEVVSGVINIVGVLLAFVAIYFIIYSL